MLLSSNLLLFTVYNDYETTFIINYLKINKNKTLQTHFQVLSEKGKKSAKIYSTSMSTQIRGLDRFHQRKTIKKRVDLK